MNCCDDYGECHQGRDCPIRKQMALEGDLDTSWLPIVVFIVSMAVVISIVVWGGQW